MKIIKLDKIEKIKVDMDGAKNTYKQVPISIYNGSPTFSLRVFTVEPNGYTPFHKHNYEHLNYIIDGYGVLVNENGDEQEVKKGNFAIVMPNEKHQYKNKSIDKPLIMICGVPIEFEK